VSGKPDTPSRVLQVRVLQPDGTLKLGDESLLAAPGNKWVDLCGPDEATLTRLGERFGLHKLALEDCLHLDQRPKLEDYPGHHFVVLHGFSCAGDVSDIKLHEVHAFLGQDFVLTVHDHEHGAIAAAAKRVESDPAGTLGRGADFALYLVADALVDSHFPLFEQFDDEIDALEEQAFVKPTTAQLQRSFEVKRSLVLLRRVLSPQRDVVGQLARGALPFVSDRTRVYFRDVYDHLQRLYEHIDMARDLLGNAMDAWLSVTANRTNDITKQLTIFASLFLPMSFVVGFFGQNFDVLGSKPFLWVMAALLLAIPMGMVWWFHRRNWF
jgi:magnesium transporter